MHPTSPLSGLSMYSYLTPLLLMSGSIQSSQKGLKECGILLDLAHLDGLFTVRLSPPHVCVLHVDWLLLHPRLFCPSLLPLL